MNIDQPRSLVYIDYLPIQLYLEPAFSFPLKQHQLNVEFAIIWCKEQFKSDPATC